MDNQFGVLPSINLAYAAAIMERAGHKVILVDANALKISKEEAFEIVKEFNPDLMGYNLSTYMFYDTKDWIRYFKKRNILPVIVGGINLFYYPIEIMIRQDIDYAIIDEAIYSLPELLSVLENGKNFSHIEGLVFRKVDRVVINHTSPEKKMDLDLLPYPARHLLPNDKYYSHVSQRKNFAVMLSSFDCPYSCTYCAIIKAKSFKMRSTEAVVDEIQECYQKYGIREIDFLMG